MSAHLMGWAADSGRIRAPIGTLLRVGATPDNDVVVRVDGVSRTHARIVGESDGYWIEDANSRNGTWLNGERIKRARLRHLDVITLGRFAELVFVERAPADAPAIAQPASMRVRIEWLDGDRGGEFVDIPRGETVIGRAESCALMIDSPAVSRAHARISNTGDRVVIEDLGSANGTSVDGQLLSGPMTLRSGSVVTIGEQRRFRVVVEGATEPARAEVPGAVPARAQDMEWATRLVYSAADLEAISAAAGRIDKPSPPVMKPVGKDPSPPIVPVPPPPIVAGALPIVSEPPPQPPATAPATDGTRAASADLRVPPRLEPEQPPDGATRFEAPAIGRPPSFSVSKAASDTGGTRLDDPVLKPPPFMAEPRASSGPSEAVEDNKLPTATELGVPTVGPPPKTLATPTGDAATAWAAPPTGKKPSAVTSVEFSGDAGVFSLPKGTSTVGRSADATMRIDSREISRIHAAVTVTDREVIVEDRNSANGTAVNGRVITEPTALAPGDRVSFADFEFRVELTWTEGNGSE